MIGAELFKSEPARVLMKGNGAEDMVRQVGERSCSDSKP